MMAATTGPDALAKLAGLPNAVVAGRLVESAKLARQYEAYTRAYGSDTSSDSTSSATTSARAERPPGCRARRAARRRGFLLIDRGGYLHAPYL